MSRVSNHKNHYKTRHNKVVRDQWWRHAMDLLSALLALCEEMSPLGGGFASQRARNTSFDVSLVPAQANIWITVDLLVICFAMRLLWHHRNAVPIVKIYSHITWTVWIILVFEYFEWNKLTKYATIGAITPPTRAPIEHAEKAMLLENQ